MLLLFNKGGLPRVVGNLKRNIHDFGSKVERIARPRSSGTTGRAASSTSGRSSMGGRPGSTLRTSSSVGRGSKGKRWSRPASSVQETS